MVENLKFVSYIQHLQIVESTMPPSICYILYIKLIYPFLFILNDMKNNAKLNCSQKQKQKE